MTKQDRSLIINNLSPKYETKNCVLYMALTTILSIISVAYLYIYFYTELLQYKYQTLSDYRNEGSYTQRLVCYYAAPVLNARSDIKLNDVPNDLCTHLNIGIADLKNSTIVMSYALSDVLEKELPIFRKNNQNVKLILWVGGANSGPEFTAMVANHETRKRFLGSLRDTLNKYPLDGIDIDWEFPTAYNKERQHLSQLLYELRMEWQRERHPNRILSLAVAAPEGIALFAYDFAELNKYVDYVNLMTYDFHFYSKGTPFTGLNAPLYARKDEHSILGTLNIFYSVHWWLEKGIDPHRLVVGLPTYGHSFTLYNPFNNNINAPASGFGRCGNFGFTTYSETCHCVKTHFNVVHKFDNDTCSPYLFGGDEWISYEDERSIKCKAEFVRDLNVGGVMLFSLNSDDIHNNCHEDKNDGMPKTYPLTLTVKDVLAQSSSNKTSK